MRECVPARQAVGDALGYRALGDENSIAEVWRRLNTDHAARPTLSVLAREGPFGLLAEARQTGFTPQPTYAGKCHLCWNLRKHLASLALHADILAPDWLYAR